MQQLTQTQLKALTLYELETLIQTIDKYVAEYSAYQLQVHSIAEQQRTAVAMAAKVARMTPGEREALSQALAPAGVPSSETVSKL